MILYSKNGDFLGMGKDELSFLGYEDLDEFTSIHSDVADLFINKPGYIFKFKNFSWIDYALHSGAPKKSAIIKLKTGNEVEIAIKIKELFLYNPKENGELYYTVEFVNNISQNNTLVSESEFIQKTSVPTSETIEEPPPVEEDFVQEETPDLAVDYNQEKEESPTPKLKIDNNIFEHNEEKTEPEIDFNSDFIENYERDETPKLKIDVETKQEPLIESTMEISSDEEEATPIIDTPTNIEITKKKENIDFDLVNCVEELGLDISLVGELITDYIDKIDENIPHIKNAIENEDEVLLKSSVYKLKGVSDNLHMNQLSSKLENILEATNKMEKEEKLDKFKKMVEKFRGELI